MGNNPQTMRKNLLNKTKPWFPGMAWLLCMSLVLPSCEETVKESSYTIDLRKPDREIITGGLKLGGESPSGGKIAFNSYYMEMDGKPFIPIMGEVHYSRVPVESWEEIILKMKSGGINLICTYVFWSMHEQYEGVFDWSGNLDLRHFLLLCKQHDMNVIVRMGPFCHGEIRNGGIPDWIYGRPFQIRTNDSGYLKYVDRLYGQIAEQMKGLYYKDGGNIIGVQFENELQHSAAPWSFNYPGQKTAYTVADYDIDNTSAGVSVTDGEVSAADLGTRHMKTLKEIALSKGIDVSLYTATGWGNAAIIPGECIPLTAAYPYPFWSETVELSPFYLFKDIQANPDYAPVRYEPLQYPSFCGEMGAGIQMIYSRRPRVPANAAEAMMIRSLGSGANGIGYYMYAGGTTPTGRFGFFSDEPMGIPKMSYDFQAPVGEFGKTRDSYNHLRVIHLFTDGFGTQLAPMGVVLPEGYETIKPEDRTTLRYAVRKKGDSGFIFINNFQDHAENLDISDVSLTLQLQGEEIRIPANGTMTVGKEVCAILPFNMSLEGIMLKSATAQPLARIATGAGMHYFFFVPDGLPSEYVFDPATLKQGSESVIRPMPGTESTVELIGADGTIVLLTTLTRAQALNTVKVKLGDTELLLVTGADVLPGEDHLKLLDTTSTVSLVCFPGVQMRSDNGKLQINSGSKQFFSELTATQPVIEVTPEINKATDRRYSISLPAESWKNNPADLILSVDYTGDTGAAFINGNMVTDHFYSGDPWNIGLKKFREELTTSGLDLYLRPLAPDVPFMIDLPKDHGIDFSKGNVLEVNSIRIIPEYEFDIKL